MDYIVYLVVSGVLIVLAAMFILTKVRTALIYEYEAGLKFYKGKLTGILEAGKYTYYAPNTRIQVIDTRPQLLTIPGQELLTADNISIKISLVVKYKVSDPEKAVRSSQDYYADLYAIAQTSLRSLICEINIDNLLLQRNSLSSNLCKLMNEQVSEYGLELLSAEVRDIMFPGEVKKIFAQIVNAQKEGLAALERARGETAALRNLANASRLFEGKPNLMTLRILQTLSQTSGNTIILNTTDAMPPVIKKDS